MMVFAHRGASAYAPQNTLPAFQKALDMGAKHIELDIQLSADQVPVVIHDFVLEASTDSSGFIHRLSWKELQKADAGIPFSKDFAGTPIPSLEEVLALIPKDVLLNIEIKAISSLEEPVAAILADMLEQEKERKLLISSFNHPILKEFQERCPDIPVGILTGSDFVDPVGYAESSGIKASSLHPQAPYVTKAYTEAAHAQDMKVFCWTINSREQAGMMEALGVDGVFSDYPDLLC